MKSVRKRKFRVVAQDYGKIFEQSSSLAAYEILGQAGIHPKFSKREREIISVLAPLIKRPAVKRGRPKGDGAPIQDAMQSFGLANQYFARNGGKRMASFVAAAEELGRSEHTIKKHFLAAKKYFSDLGAHLKGNSLTGLSLGDVEPGSVEYWQIFLDQHYRKEERASNSKNPRNE